MWIKADGNKITAVGCRWLAKGEWKKIQWLDLGKNMVKKGGMIWVGVE